jgi:hypothetical protein
MTGIKGKGILGSHGKIVEKEITDTGSLEPTESSSLLLSFE